MEKSKKKKIIELYNNVCDKAALEELYKETNDPLAKILLKWKDYYREELKYTYNSKYHMYSDIIDYLFEKYKLKEV